MKQSPRSERVAELIREEIARLLVRGIKDPRVGFVSVMGVRMSSDLHYANVYVSLYGDEKQRKSSLIALRNSEGWIRREVGKHLRMRVTPAVRFFPDDSLDQVYHLEDVFQEIRKEREISPMIKLSLAELAGELQKSKSFLITAHTNPDGDSIGSTLALRYLLEAMGKKHVTICMADPVPTLYQDLPGAKKIKVFDPEADAPEYETAILVDCNRRDRIGSVDTWIPEGKRVIIIDHHLGDDPQGDAGFIDTGYAACGEIMAELFQVAGIPISKQAAHCAYVALVTDTGGFRYANTTPRSLRVGAALSESGIDTAAICTHVFDVMTLPKFKLLRIALERMAFAAAGKCAYTHILPEDFAETQGKREDLEGIVNFARKVEGVEVGALFTGLGADGCKVSLRSGNKLNVAHFLEQFGGGGHAQAAGASSKELLEDFMPAVVAALTSALDSHS